MHQFLKPVQIIAVSIAFIFLSSHLFATSAEKDDVVHSFNFEQSDLKAHKGFSYKRLKELFGDHADELGAHVHDNGRKLVITDNEKFKKTFRDLHLRFLAFSGTNEKILKFYSKSRSYDEDFYTILQHLCFDRSCIFNLTSESTIRGVFDKEELLTMINSTLSSMKHYAFKKMNPKTTSAIEKLLVNENEDENDDEAAPREEDGVGPFVDGHDGDEGNFGEGASNFSHDAISGDDALEGDVDDGLAELLNTHKKLNKRKASIENGREEDALDDRADGTSYPERREEDGLYEDLEVEKQALEEEVEKKEGLIQQQKKKIATLSISATTLMPLLLEHLGIDVKQLKDAIAKQNSSALQSLLSPVLSGDDFEDAMEDIKAEWDPDDGDEEENSAAKDSGDEEGSGDEGSGE